MSLVKGGGAHRITISPEMGGDIDATNLAARYIAIRLKAVASHRAWVETGDTAHLRKRDEHIFRAMEIVTSIRDLIGHEASKQFARDADQAFGPVRFWS